MLANIFIFVAHTLIGFYFAFFGFWNVYHWRPLIKDLSEKSIPHPYLILPIGIVLQTIAGFFIMFGVLVKLSALLLIPFTVIAICIFHDFWNHEGEWRRLHFTNFMANMTISLGALFLLLNTISPMQHVVELFT